MLVTLRILFTVVSAVLVAALIPVGTLLGWVWAGVCGILAVLFFVLMLLCKQSQQQKEENDQRFGDNYITPTKTDEDK